MLDLNLAWILLCTGLVFLMQAGFMCLESGLTRRKNSINVAVKNLSDFGISVLLFWAFGYAFMFGTSQQGWLGHAGFFPSFDGTPATAVFFLYQAMFCGTATTIISGAVAERLTFRSYLVASAIVSGAIYPIFGHWAWNGLPTGTTAGWLGQLGFVDFAGSTVVHGTGAWVSLAALRIVGPRQGRFTADGKGQKIQGSNMPFSVLGAFLLWFGWIGFNGGSTLALDARVPGIVVNTILAGVAGLVAAVIFSELQRGLVEVESLTNGSLAGLVAITACCHVVSPGIAVIVGATGAAVATLVDRWLTRWQVDDAVGAVAVHGGSGLWGTLCVALFGQLSAIDTGLGRVEQLLVQLLGAGICLAWSFGVGWGLLSALNRVSPLRVSPKVEAVGLNISEHGAKTDTYELFQVMDRQARTQDLSLRVPIEPFTEVGHIATRYNQVMANLEQQHQQQVDDLEQLYFLVAVAAAAIDSGRFQVESLDFEAAPERQDELGNLARILQRLVGEIQTRDRALAAIGPQLAALDAPTKTAILLRLLQARLGEEVPSEVKAELVALAGSSDRWQQLWQAATAARSWEELQGQAIAEGPRTP